MKINNNSIFQPSFKAKFVNNHSLRILVKDIRTMYGDEYLKTAIKKFNEIGLDEDEIKFVYSTWVSQKGLGLESRKEGVTYILLNDKYIGFFENRFISNFLAQTKKYINNHGIPLKKNIEEITPTIIKKSKKENKLFKIFKNIKNWYKTDY